MQYQSNKDFNLLNAVLLVFL